LERSRIVLEKEERAKCSEVGDGHPLDRRAP
jgi:hypothetical protein